ncbi:hypothetical protein E2C01_101925 [Portunus trituberculatus]|uniref:Uncharacterized protein n=1 Tax=Portunus trituberculatus TaxID=210409 RepID=A0A5B7KN20_PORTR|nr:hypothetical protein [Portunus trituberculatus]
MSRKTRSGTEIKENGRKSKRRQWTEGSRSPPLAATRPSSTCQPVSILPSIVKVASRVGACFSAPPRPAPPLLL